MKPSIARMLKDIFNQLFISNDKTQGENNNEYEEEKPIPITENLEDNIKIIKALLMSDDVVFRNVEIATPKSTKGTLVFIESMVNQDVLEATVFAPLTKNIRELSFDRKTHFHLNIESLLNNVLTNSNISYYRDATAAIDQVLAGDGALFIHGYSKAIVFNIAKTEAKESAEPNTEKVVKGPQQGFVEDLSNNIRMLRRRIKSPHLVVKKLTLGRESKTEIGVAYLNNIVDFSIVEELFIRLNRIDVDGIKGSSNIEEYINDASRNLFPTTFFTERPDRVQSMLLEGRIAIICDQSPFVIVVPAIITDFFSSTEDYYLNFYFATFNRILRYLGSFMVMFLPGIYIAVSTFHHEMIPTRLALTLAGTRAGVPYPAFVETLLMETAFEALREAGIRLPTHIGQAVSIVGALIIGQAAVEAGLVSPAVVIVVAATAIFSFTMPFTNFSLSLRLSRFFIMALAATLGIYGLMAGGLIIALNLVSLRSFGIPFMIPFAPYNLQDMRDWVFRFPQWAIPKRSSQISKKNISKIASHLEPHPPNNNRSEEQ